MPRISNAMPIHSPRCDPRLPEAALRIGSGRGRICMCLDFHRNVSLAGTCGPPLRHYYPGVPWYSYYDSQS
jgi:hypothetical protein